MITKTSSGKEATEMLERHIANTQASVINENISVDNENILKESQAPIDDRTGDEIKDDESKLYDISSFSL